MNRLLCLDRIDRANVIALVLLRLYCKLFNVLSLSVSIASAKLSRIFELTKFLFIYLTIFNHFHVRFASFPKASAKLHLFPLPTKYFDNFFMLKNMII